MLTCATRAPSTAATMFSFVFLSSLHLPKPIPNVDPSDPPRRALAPSPPFTHPGPQQSHAAGLLSDLTLDGEAPTLSQATRLVAHSCVQLQSLALQKADTFTHLILSRGPHKLRPALHPRGCLGLSPKFVREQPESCR